MQKDVGVFLLRNHLFRVGDEVRGEITAIELHTFYDVQLGIQALGFFYRDNTFITYLLHGGGDHLTDLVLTIGRNGPYLGDFLTVGDFLRTLF